MFPLLLYFRLCMLLIQYKISVFSCPFRVIFYILRNIYLTFTDFCIAYHIVVIATFHTDILIHTLKTFSMGLMTYQLNIP